MNDSKKRSWSGAILIGLLVMVILLFLGSCTPQRRLSKLLKKNPQLMTETTIIDIDTFFINIPAVHTDSVVHINRFYHDTIIMQNERLKIMTYVYKDSVYIFGECTEIIDTIVKTEFINVPVFVNKKEYGNIWLLVISLILLALALYSRFKISNYERKKGR